MPALPILTRIWSLNSLQHSGGMEELEFYTVTQDSAVMRPTLIFWASGKILCASPCPWIWRLVSFESEQADAMTQKCPDGWWSGQYWARDAVSENSSALRSSMPVFQLLLTSAGSTAGPTMSNTLWNTHKKSATLGSFTKQLSCR